MFSAILAQNTQKFSAWKNPEGVTKSFYKRNFFSSRWAPVKLTKGPLAR
jgi:hypothetical protein